MSTGDDRAGREDESRNGKADKSLIGFFFFLAPNTHS